MMITSDDNNKGGSKDSLIAALVAASAEISFHLDPAGTIIDFHGGRAARSALLPELFVGKRLTDIFPPELADLFCSGLKQALEREETVTFEFPLQLTTKRLAFEARFIPFSSGKVIAIIANISSRKQAQEIRRLIDERFRTIFRSTSAGMVLAAPDGSLIEVNPSFCNFLGYSKDELLKLTVEEITHPDDREMSRRKRSASLQGANSSYTYEKRYLRKDGSTVWGQLSSNWFHDEDDRPVYAVGLIQDITERKRAEEALRESEEKFAKAFRATPTILVISSLAEGRYIEVNEAFERIMGYRREEVIGRSALELNIWEHPQDRERMMKMLGDEGRIRDQEVNFREKNGKIMVGLYSAEHIDLCGKPCLLSLVNDITARKQLEEKNEILNTDLACRAVELENANRELETFSHTVSHDLRSPLTGITGYSELLLECHGDRLDEQSRSYLEHIHSASLRMGQLINALLDFSSLTRVEIQRQTVDLSSLAREISVELRLEAPERPVNFRIAEGITVTGDGRLLRAVMQNLLGNAWKYTARNESAEIDFGATESADGRVLFVRDNGAGFDMSQADRLFTPFLRLHDEQEFAGSGIGLATVERIIRRHGGRVWATGEVGKGATFYFTLPLT